MINCPKCHYRYDPPRQRSLLQNNYYWDQVVEIVAEDQGNSKEAQHEILKSLYNTTRYFLETKNGIKEIVVVLDTKGLSTVEFNSYVERCVMGVLDELGIYIPPPEPNPNNRTT